MSIQAVLVCGHCKKRTRITDEDYEKILKTDSFNGICSCGKGSFNSYLLTKAIKERNK
jgi:hypothetical protein